MVATRSKTRRASTPLSSPPPSPAPSPPSSPAPSLGSLGSSYYTDDQSDSCYGDDYGVQSESDSDEVITSDEESETSHEERCALHSTSLETHCNGLTYARKRCSRKAHVFEEGYLPVCRTHHWYPGFQMGKAGRCQATAACGHRCNRLSPHAPPYHFCDDHGNGTESLPCYITRLPTELRLMIFRYLFPKVIGIDRLYPTHPDAYNTAVLFVSRQFHEEATALIYNETKFEVRIWPSHVQIFGKRWDRESTCHIFEEPSKKLCQPAVRRIRHLHVQVNFALTQSNIKGVCGPSRAYEEYELYQLRDTIRKFVEVLAPLPRASRPLALKRLSVTPAPSCRQLWRSEEAIAAIFFALEPFTRLRPIGRVELQPPPRPELYTWRERNFISIIADLPKDEHYQLCRNQWTSTMTFGTEPVNSDLVDISDGLALAAAHRKIEDFARLIYKQDAAELSGTAVKHAWTSSIFQGIERVLHIARVGYEDGDLGCLKKIHEAILKRWITAHQQQQRSLAAVAASVSDMFDGDVADRHEGHPEAFDFTNLDSTEEKRRPDDKWPELKMKPLAPTLKGPGLKIEEKKGKVVIIKDGEKEKWFKTPAVVRQLQEYKRNNS